MRLTLSLESFKEKPLKEEMGKIKYQRRSVECEELVENIKKRSYTICQLYGR